MIVDLLTVSNDEIGRGDDDFRLLLFFDGDTDDLGNWCRCIILRISTSAYYQKYVWS